MDHQAKEALRKEKESPKGKGDRREFRGEKWEELGWRLSTLRSKVDLDTKGREVLEGRPRFAHRKGGAGKVGR